MINKRNIIIFIVALLLFTGFKDANAQRELTRVSGIVRDSITKEPLPFVQVAFVGKNVGATTDYNGRYHIVTQWGSDQLLASFLGYKKKIKSVKEGDRQTINFNLAPTNFTLKEVIIKARKKRYRNKNNPSVDFMRKVIANKSKNRRESLDYYEYDKYEKIEFDLNNITEEFRNKKSLRNFQFIFDYVDTSLINNKPYLPLFLKETKSKVFYRKSPKSKKEFVSGTNMVGFENYIDDQGIAFYVDNMYQEINIYENNIAFMTHDFISPLSDIGPMIYKYFILDTVDVNGYNCIRVGFQPRNKGDFSFRGDMYITNDDRWAVIKIKMKVSDQINLNFVTDVQIDQEFAYVNDEAWMLTKDELVVDFNLSKKGLGLFGRKHVSYKDYVFNTPRDSKTYHSMQQVVKDIDHSRKSDEFWVKARHKKLTEKEEGIFMMIDSIQRVPAFKRTMDIIFLLISGYYDIGPISIGNMSTFYSFNEIEGFRLRLGGKTNKKFSELWMIEGFGVYGFKDDRWKYAVGVTYSLNGRYYTENPRHFIKAIYLKETQFPGMEMQFINEDNFLLSFKRGVADKIMYYTKKDVEYYYDIGNGITINGHLRHTDNETGGNWDFEFQNGSILDKITTSEFIGSIRFAPNEKYYQGVNFKIPIFTKFPVMQLTYTHGFDNILGSDYQYDKLNFNIFKRVYMAPLGYSDVEIEAGRLWGNVPLPLLYIMRANQTFSYQINSYNMMNFMEFVADKYVSVRVEHYFNGFFFNKIPLFNRLKFREVITFKGIYGGLNDSNNPGVNPNAMLFPTDINGDPTTFTLENKPYIEMSVGVANILKFFRVDLVRRMTYNTNPNVSKYGIRARFRFEF